jgi:hypothetical protein
MERIWKEAVVTSGTGPMRQEGLRRTTTKATIRTASMKDTWQLQHSVQPGKSLGNVPGWLTFALTALLSARKVQVPTVQPASS